MTYTARITITEFVPGSKDGRYGNEVPSERKTVLDVEASGMDMRTLSQFLKHQTAPFAVKDTSEVL